MDMACARHLHLHGWVALTSFQAPPGRTLMLYKYRVSFTCECVVDHELEAEPPRQPPRTRIPRDAHARHTTAHVTAGAPVRRDRRPCAPDSCQRNVHLRCPVETRRAVLHTTIYRNSGPGDSCVRGAFAAQDLCLSPLKSLCSAAHVPPPIPPCRYLVTSARLRTLRSAAQRPRPLAAPPP